MFQNVAVTPMGHRIVSLESQIFFTNIESEVSYICLNPDRKEQGRWKIDNCGGEAHIHIFVFTDCENN